MCVASPSSSDGHANMPDPLAETRPAREWRGRSPSGYELHVRREPTGRWRVIYGGFSRSASANLASALAEATGSPATTGWICALVELLAAVEIAPEPL
jgi:hypothetical protein